MTQRLYIDLSAGLSGPLPWLLWDSAQQRRIDAGSLDAASDMQRLREMSLRVPATLVLAGNECSVFRVSLPAAGKIAANALPFHLEESLCASPESLHIVGESVPANTEGCALAVDRELCQQWLDAVQAAELRVACVLPACCLIPADCAIYDDEQLIIASQRSRLELPAAQRQAPSVSTLFEQCSRRIRIGETDSLATGTAPNRLEAIAGLQRETPSWSALSGAYSPPNPAGKWLQILRWPAVALLAALSLHWAALAVEASAARNHHLLLADEIESVYRRSFPEEKRVPRPMRQMQAHLDSIAGGDEQHLLRWLGSSSEGIKDLPGVTIGGLRYRASPESMRMDLEVPDFDTLNRFISAVESKGHAVERGAFSQEQATLKGHIVLTEASP